MHGLADRFSMRPRAERASMLENPMAQSAPKRGHARSPVARADRVLVTAMTLCVGLASAVFGAVVARRSCSSSFKTV